METMDKKHWVIEMYRNGCQSQQGFYGTEREARNFAKFLAIAIAIGAIVYNPGHLFSAALIWYGAKELLTIE